MQSHAEHRSPGAPALVLIHGYAAPTAWWNPLILLLAKKHGALGAEPLLSFTGAGRARSPRAS